MDALPTLRGRGSQYFWTKTSSGHLWRKEIWHMVNIERKFILLHSTRSFLRRRGAARLSALVPALHPFISGCGEGWTSIPRMHV